MEEEPSSSTAAMDGQQEHISEGEEMLIQGQLHEDEAFLLLQGHVPPKTTTATALCENKDDNTDKDELEEDDTFLIARTAPSAAADADAPGHAHAPSVPVQPEPVVEDLLEEDPAFLVESVAEWPQLSQLAKTGTETRTTHGSEKDDDDDDDDDDNDLPSVSQVYGNVTTREKHRLDVSNLHLGQKNDPTRAIGATSYSGQRVIFERKLGNRMIGQVRLEPPSGPLLESKARKRSDASRDVLTPRAGPRARTAQRHGPKSTRKARNDAPRRARARPHGAHRSRHECKGSRSGPGASGRIGGSGHDA